MVGLGGMMPYIKDLGRRQIISNIVNLLVEEKIKTNGELNCLLFMLFRRTIGNDMSYNKCKDFLSELEECSQEIRRRFLVPYEIEKVRDNGDVI